jgi:hypothetical protein
LLETRHSRAGRSPWSPSLGASLSPSAPRAHRTPGPGPNIGPGPVASPTDSHIGPEIHALARSVLDAIETGPDSDNLATNIAALIIGASLLVGAILAIIVIGIFIGASLGALGVVLYGAAIITGALKLLEHLIIKEDQ